MWEVLKAVLVSCAGGLARMLNQKDKRVLTMVMLLTQFTEEFTFTKRIPTQLWSYILSIFVLIAATVFTEGLSVNGVMQAVFNAVVVSIAANGGYGILQKVKESVQKQWFITCLFLHFSGCPLENAEKVIILKKTKVNHCLPACALRRRAFFSMYSPRLF